MALFFIGLLFFLIISMWIASSVGIQNAKAMQAAKKAYENSLTELREDPNNASLRRTTLDLGRTYSNLTRNKQGVSIFDEVALKNDIDAACAGAVVMSHLSQSGNAKTIQERLARLDALFESDAISPEEYVERRERILDSL